MRVVGLAIAFGLMAAILWLGQNSAITRLSAIDAAGGAPSLGLDATTPEPLRLVEQLGEPSGDPSDGSRWLVAVGFMLLASFLAGNAAKSMKLPKITGYLAAGALVGPSCLGFIQGSMIEDMAIIKGVAVSLIALNAGGELNFAWVYKRLREVSTIFATKVVVVGLAVAVCVFSLRGHLGTIPVAQPGVLVSVVLLVSVVSIANSPTVAIALINETRSEGPLSRMVLVISVFKDIFLVVVFTMALEICRTLTSDVALSAGVFTELILLKVLGSIAFGAAIGWVLAVYVRRVGREMPMVILVACLFIALVGEHLHFKPLLVALAAGCFVENFAKDAGHKVIEGIRRMSLPVYCLFFALAGVELHFGELRRLGLVVPALAMARFAGVWGGCRLGTTFADSEEVIRSYLWGGLVSQAGLSLAFASIIAEAFAWGPSVATLLIAMIVLHEVFGPIIFNWTLQRSGEAGMAGQPAPATAPTTV